MAHRAVHAVALDALDVEHDLAVVEQEDIARLHVLGQLPVVEADLRSVAELELGVEHEPVPRLELDAAVLELPDADLGSLQVGHDADGAEGLAAELAHALRAL